MGDVHGAERRRQREATKQAEAKLADLLHSIDKGTYVDASKTTLVAYLRDWHAKAAGATQWRPETARVYLSMIEKHVAPSSLATVPLQKVRASDLEEFYATLTHSKSPKKKLSASSVTVCHAVIGRALKMAVRDRLIAANPATAVEHRPRVSKDRGQNARKHCWSADEARAVMAAAKAAGPQVSAFFALALDTGARKSELLGLTWAHVDLDAGTLTIAQQLAPRGGARIAFGPTKTGTPRTVTLGAETITRLRLHRKHQRELMLANGAAYQKHDLVFANEHADLQTPRAALGQPCRALVGRHFRRVVAAAGVRPIKVHGTRHTAATLLLSVGVPVQVVAERLGHAQITQTLEVYAHALPDMQRDAAARLDAVLTGR